MAIVFYSLWATDSTMVKMSDNLLIWTVPVVMLICMKYSLNVEKGSDGDPTNIILSDKILILLGLILLIMLLFILYF